MLLAAARATAAQALSLRLELTAVTEQLPGVFSLLPSHSLSTTAAAHDAATGSALPLQRLQRAITPDVCSSLAAQVSVECGDGRQGLW
jgi:hypothetical protein